MSNVGHARDLRQGTIRGTSNAQRAAHGDARSQGHARPFGRDGHASNGRTHAARILQLVSDTGLLAQLERLAILHDEFAVERTESVQAALKQAVEDRVDVILLDTAFAEMDAHLLCRLMRSKGVTCPIIMLSSAEADAEVVLGFESGASDFVTGPLNMKTFVARLRAHARRSESEEKVACKFGPYLFNFGDNSLIDSARDQRIHLTLKEAMLLRHLCRRNGHPVHRDDLLRNVWNWEPTLFTHTLESHIYRLRRKLEPDPHSPVFILTTASGYQIAS